MNRMLTVTVNTVLRSYVTCLYFVTAMRLCRLRLLYVVTCLRDEILKYILCESAQDSVFNDFLQSGLV